MVVLIVFIVFFSSVGKEPFHAMGVTVKPEACAAEAARLKKQADADPEVQGYVIDCRPVGGKV